MKKKLYHLAEIGVQFSNTVWQLLNILCQQLVGICNTIVEIWHFVERETPAWQQNNFSMHTQDDLATSTMAVGQKYKVF